MSYDGNKPARWSECVWQPKGIRNKITQFKVDALMELRDALMELKRELTESQRQQLRHRGYNI